MAKIYSLNEVTEKEWVRKCLQEYNSLGDNSAELKKILDAIHFLVKYKLPAKQRDYWNEYYYNNKDMLAIAQTYHVDVSTVSRCLKRARQEVWDIIVICFPSMRIPGWESRLNQDPVKLSSKKRSGIDHYLKGGGENGR